MKFGIRMRLSVSLLALASWVSFGQDDILMRSASKYKYTQEDWEKLESAFKKYPFKVKRPSEKRLVVQVSATPQDIHGAQFSAKNQANYTVFSAKDGADAYMSLSLGSSPIKQLRTTIELSFRTFLVMTRMSTWSGAACMKLNDADFLAHLDGGSKLYATKENLEVVIATTSRTSDEALLSSLATPILQLFSKDAAELQKDKSIKSVNANDKTITLLNKGQKDGVVTIEWSLPEKSTNRWCFVDVEKGELSIDADKANSIKVAKLPKDGSKLHFYSISSDGKVWHHREMLVTP